MSLLDDLPLSMEDEVGGIARIPLVAGNNYIERLANRWNFSAKIYLNHKDRLFLIRYEDFVLDKIETINSLARQIGLKPINNINEYINVQYPDCLTQVPQSHILIGFCISA